MTSATTVFGSSKNPQIFLCMYSEIFAMNDIAYLEISYFQLPAFLILAA